MNNLSKEFQRALGGMDQRTWAKRAHVDAGTVTKLIQGARPGPKLLKALFTAWDDKSIGKKLLAANLRDEVLRVGGNPSDIKIAC